MTAGGIAPAPSDESFELFVPGRLCLFGEHSDWAGAMRRCGGPWQYSCCRCLSNPKAACPALPLCSPTITSPHLSAQCRQNPDIVPGRTIVVGTQQGLYAHITPLAAPVLRLRSTKNDGSVLECELPLEEATLAEAGCKQQLALLLDVMLKAAAEDPSTLGGPRCPKEDGQLTGHPPSTPRSLT